MNNLKLILLLSMFATFSSSKAQTRPDVLEARLNSYLKNHPSSTLYLHLDKNNYSPSESIWFKAYLLKGEFRDNKVIYIRIADENNKIILRRQFMMYDIRAHGDLLLPETIKEGNYTFFAYTDRMINFNDRDVFVQPLTIRRDAEKTFEAEAFVTDTSQLVRGGKVQVTVRIKQGNNLLKNIRGNYVLLDENKTIKSGRITTNHFGEAFIQFIYPQLADDKPLEFKASFRKEKEYAELTLNLQHEGNKLTVSLYPEGGNLVAGMPCKTIIEAIDANKNPVSTNLIFMNGANTMMSVRTNKQGFALVNFTPETGADYKIQAIVSGRKSFLPFNRPVEAAGYGISISKLKKNVLATIKNRNESNAALLVLRSAERVLWSKEVLINNGDSLIIPFLLDSLPKTLLSLAIFDNRGKPVAERIFLNKQEEESQLDIKTDSKLYGRRKKVTITLNTSDASENPVPANLSVAVIEKNGMSPSTYRTIVHSYYYSALEGNLAPFIAGLSDNEFDNLLITKNWRDNWHSVINPVSNEPFEILSNTSGVVGFVKQKVKGKFDVKAVTLRSVKNPLVRYTFPVGDDQIFSIPAEQLLIDDTDELYIGTSAKFNSEYEIVYYTPDRRFDKKITDGNALFSPIIFNTFASKKPPIDKLSLRGAIQLKEVKIGGIIPPVNDLQTGKCRDFVCSYNILNCTGHHTANSQGSFSPVEGGRYLHRNTLVTYYGCDDYRFKSISKPKNFPTLNFEKDILAEPLWGTTIFWEPNTRTTKSGTNSVSFFTSDLAGEYMVIVQGLNVNTLKPLYSSTAFSVK